MIVRMKRLTLLCRTADRDATVAALRDLGVVHVADRQPPAGEELDALRDRLAGARRALAALDAAADEAGSEDAQATASPPATALSPGASAEALVAEVLELIGRRDELTDQVAALQGELDRYDVFGDFDLQVVHALERAGVTTALGVAPAAAKLVAPDDIVLVPQYRDRRRQSFTLVAQGVVQPWPPDLGAEYEVVPWPERPLAEMRRELAAAGAAARELSDRLAALAAGRETIDADAAETSEKLRFTEVRAGMERAGQVSLLTGYLPVGDCETVRSSAAAHGWGLVFDDPQPGEDVPTLLRQSRWVRPVRTVFDFLHIYPGYWEADPGWVFLPFFTLFFAMIVGDAGYAVLLLGLTAILQWRLQKVPRHVFAMMYIAGAATLFWGVVNGSYFGFAAPWSFLAGLEVPWIKDRDNLIDLCFFIGAVHLSFAHVWNAASLASKGSWSKVPAQAGWLLVVWSMFFIARQAVLGRAMPGYLLYLLLAGIVLVVVFMKTPKELKGNVIDHALLPLTLVGNFVDVLSYIRLFAVGYAGVAVLAAFNEMALSIGFDSVATAVAASLVLLFANALNIALCGLGVLVHAVRLNTLEFSTHKGLAWQGHDLYAPFAGRRGAT